MEEAASGIAPLPDLRRVRDAISKLQQASLNLDVKKLKAEGAFRKAVRNLPRGRLGRRIIRRIKRWIMRLLGIDTPMPNDAELKFPALHALNTRDATERRKGWPCDLIDAATRVKTVNQKLALFERGFISEEGVKDREWYRHLGVAPGKYLGRSLCSPGRDTHSIC